MENLNADSLSIPEEEYRRYMTGEAVPHDPSKVGSCEGLQLMQQNLSSLGQLRDRQEKLMAEALQLQQDMVHFKDNFRQEIQDVLSRTPLTIKPRKQKVNIDEETSDADRLPPPLLPQVIDSRGSPVPMSGDLQQPISCENQVQSMVETSGGREQSLSDDFGEKKNEDSTPDCVNNNEDVTTGSTEENDVIQTSPVTLS